MLTKIDRSAPLPSAAFRFATLTSTTRWGGEQNKTPTTNRKRKVPNLFQDLTFSAEFFNPPYTCKPHQLGVQKYGLIKGCWAGFPRSNYACGEAKVAIEQNFRISA